MDFTLQMIEEITKQFSDEQKIGNGGYGEVYKGVHNGKEIAVKKLFPLHGVDDKEFRNECLNLIRVQHQNIVKLIGYCYETRSRHVKHNGELVFAKSTERILCFEYMKNGSLANYISDESGALDRSTRYRIIKGTCEGLNYIHNGPIYNGRNDHIYNLDLKPGNILLDDKMEPKIADFGGFMPPEFIKQNVISEKFDVFSLGVIIIQVHKKWKERLQAMSRYASHEPEMIRVRRCIEISLTCVDTDRERRPTIMEIVQELKELDAKIEKMLMHQPQPLLGQTSSESKHFRLDPALELRFPFELKRDIPCCLQLANQTDDFIVFSAKVNQKKYSTQPNKGIMAPWSKCYVIVTMKAQKAPPYFQCHDMFLVQSTRVNEDLQPEDITEGLFNKTMGNVVDEEKLPIVYVALPES